MHHNIPYQLAQFWDQKGTVRERVEQRKSAFGSGPAQRSTVGRVPRDLHTKAKRTPAVKSWLRVLEEPVRQFLVDRGVAGAADSDSSSLDSEDEEIVFVGRNGSMTDARAWKKARRETKDHEVVQQGMVLDSIGDDESASFKYVRPFPCPRFRCLLFGLLSALRRLLTLGFRIGGGSRTRYPTITDSTPSPLRWALL